MRGGAPLGWVAAVLVVVGMPSRAPGEEAPATVPEEALARARRVIDRLEAEDHSAAVELLEPDTCAALAGAPAAAYGVAEAVTRTHLRAREDDPASAELLLERLGALTPATDPSPHATGARALRDLLRSLTARLHGRPVALDDVRTALAALRKAEASLPPTLPVLDAALALAGFVAHSRSADADAWGAVLAVAEPMRKARAADQDFLYAVATAELHRGMLLAASDPAGARPLLERALATFASKGWCGRKKGGAWTEDARLFNRALTTAKDVGGAARIAYTHDTFWSRGRSLSAAIPALAGWTWSYGESDQEYGEIVRKRPGETLEIQIWGYNAWTTYTSADGSETPGENLDGFLKKGMKSDRDSLAKVARETRTTGPLSATIQDTKGYDMKGVAHDGVPTRYRNWFFRHSLEDRRYFNVSLTQTGTYSEKDPELLFVLDSLREHAGGGK